MNTKELNNNIDISLFALCLLAGLLLAAPASSFAQSLAQSSAQSQPSNFTDELWSEIQPLYAKTLEHPFLTEMADGMLPQEKFQYYLIQDAHYLRRFSHALSVLAAKAPRPEWSVTLNEHAAETLQGEQQLHLSIGKSFGVSPEEFISATVAPLNTAYTNHLIAAAYSRPFAEGLAALLPCYWIYWEVGKQMVQKGSKVPYYQRWIDQYAGEEYGQQVQTVLDMMNALAAEQDAPSRQRMRQLFVTSARYEWMFWDMAYRLERWPPP